MPDTGDIAEPTCLDVQQGVGAPVRQPLSIGGWGLAALLIAGPLIADQAELARLGFGPGECRCEARECRTSAAKPLPGFSLPSSAVYQVRRSRTSRPS